MAAARFLNKETASDIKRKSRSNPDLFKVTVESTKTSSYTRNKTIDDELFDLCELSGVKMSPDLFKIVLDLLRLNVNPNTIADVIKRMTSHKPSTSRKDELHPGDDPAVQRHGSDNVKTKTKSSLSALINESTVTRAQSMY